MNRQFGHRRSGFAITRTLLISGLTGALGFLALIVGREYGIAKGRQDDIRRIENGAAEVARYMHGVVNTGRQPAEAAPALKRPADPRVVILKSQRKLRLFDGRRLVAEWDIALGTQPVGDKLLEGDGKTPEGLFYVCTRNSLSKFHRFIGLSYPGIAHADRGLREKLLTHEQAESIRKAVVARKTPPWTTKLGGSIGIHGAGAQTVTGDWTTGCIALTDEGVEQLFRVLEDGDAVEIRP